MRNKMISSFLAFLIFTNCFIFNIRVGAADYIQKVRLVSLTYDKEVYTPGDIIEITMKLEADEGIVIRYSNITIGEGDANIYLGLRYDEQSDAYKGKYQVTEKTTSTTYESTTVFVSYRDINNDDHPIVFTNKDSQMGSFRVTGTESMDYKAPVISNASINLDKATVGDVVKISAEVKDDRSELVSVIFQYDSPNYNDVKIPCSYNEITDRYEVEIPITDETECGLYDDMYIYATDEAKNTRPHSFYNQKLIVSGTSDTTDITKPYIRNVRASDTTATDTNILDGEIIVEISERQTSIEKIELIYELNGIEVTIDNFQLKDNSNLEEQVFISKFETFKTFGYEGTWYLKQATAVDKVGNARVLDLADGSHYFSDSRIYVEDDVTLPEIINYSIDKSNATVGDTVNLIIDFKSGINVDGTSLYYIIDDKEFIERDMYSKKEKSNKEIRLTYPIEITDDMLSGEYKFVLRFKSSKDFDYDESVMLDINLNVYGTKNKTIDVNSDIFEEVKVNNKILTNGDTVKISAKINEKIDNVNYVIAVYKTEDAVWNKYRKVALFYNEITGLYETEQKISEDSRNGVWELQYIEVGYNYKNSRNKENIKIFNYDKDLSQGNFKIIGGNVYQNVADFSIEVNSNYLQANEKLKVSVSSARDMGPYSAVELLIASKGREFKTYLEYDENEDRYIGFIDMPSYMVSTTSYTFLVHTYSFDYGKKTRHITKEASDRDYNDDGVINVLDLAVMANEYNNQSYSDTYKYDINNDKIIDIYDIVKLGKLI